MRELVLDVSRWDEGIDLQAWKALHGLWGVICKAGGNEGGRYADRAFSDHYDAAVAAGIHVGAYYYTTATDADEAARDARHCLEIIGSRSLDLPVYIDVEDAGQTTIGKRRLTDVCLAFIRAIEAAGHRGGVYTSGSWWQNHVYADELRPYANWIAWWTENRPSAISDVGMWQFGCMRLSDGDIVHDDVGRYTDANWCYVDYPNERRGEDMTKLTYQLAAAEVMDHFVDHDAHGYSQINRDGVGSESIVLSDGTDVAFSGGDRDCSRLIQTCYVVVGALPRGMHMWTGNEREILLDNGFVEVSLDSLQRGDVLWVAGHTEMYMGDGIQAGARQSEYGGIDGATGDQTGEEIARSVYNRWEWTSAYRCTKVRPGSDRQEPKKPKQDAGKPKNDAGLKYNAHVADVGWLDVVRDGQTAGTVGYGKRLEAITVNPPAGWELRFKLHIQNVGWKVYAGIAHGNETIIGTVGKGNAIECMIVDVTKHPEGDKRKLYFQVHQSNLGWKGVTPQGYASGTDGMGIQLEAVRIWLA